MKKIVAVLAAAVLAVMLAGCGSQEAQSSSASSEVVSSSAEASSPASSPESSSAQSQEALTAKWVDVASADEAAKGAGFDKFGVMDEITLGDTKFSSPRFAYADGVAQAVYETGAMGLIVRKADGQHTATLTDRDKTEFAQTWFGNYEGLDVTCYGESKDTATVITWADGTKEYGVTYQGLGGEEISLDPKDVAAIVKAIKEADGDEQKEPEKETSADNLVTVPGVIGMEADDAAAAIEAAGLSPDGDKEGTVTKQTPEAGAKLEPGDTVSFATDASDDDDEGSITVPDVVGMDAEDAAAVIEDAGLSPDGSPEGIVTAQEPAPGTKVDPGDTVSFRADDPANEDDVAVPNVIGMDAVDAAATIEDAGLSPDGSPEGVVTDQTPRAGAMIEAGDTVSFSTDASDDDDDDDEGTAIVPSVVGMDAEDAAAAIEDAGLSPDGSPEGTVTEQMPAPGTELELGDTVSFGTDAN